MRRCIVAMILLLAACGSEEPVVPPPVDVCHDDFEECIDWALLAFETRYPPIGLAELGRMFAYCEEEYAGCMGITVDEIPYYTVELIDLDTKVTFRD